MTPTELYRDGLQQALLHELPSVPTSLRVLRQESLIPTTCTTVSVHQRPEFLDVGWEWGGLEEKTATALTDMQRLRVLPDLKDRRGLVDGKLVRDREVAQALRVLDELRLARDVGIRRDVGHEAERLRQLEWWAEGRVLCGERTEDCASCLEACQPRATRSWRKLRTKDCFPLANSRSVRGRVRWYALTILK